MTEPLDLDDYASSVQLRKLRLEDFDAIVALQLECFPSMKPWDKDQFDSLVTTFDEGQLALVVEDEIVASSSSLIVDSADYETWHNWMEIADGGYIRNHDPEGDTLYGIEMMVSPKCRGMKFSRRLYDARKELCRQYNLARIAIGGRIPGYSKHQEQMSAREYVDRVIAHDLYDPVLTSQIANGFQLSALIADYLPSDEDSAGYATSLEWPNLDFVRDRTRLRRAVDPVRVSSVQYQMHPVDSWDQFARRVEFFVDVASDSKSDFVIFPELFTLQLLSIIDECPPGEGARRLAEFTPQYVELFADLALRYNINIIGGSQFTVEDGKLYNAAYLFLRNGEIGRQDKLHPTPNEKRWWGVTGGDRIEVFDTDRGKISIQICYDSEFPEVTRVAVARGAMMVFVPYNTQDRRGHVRVSTCSHARCIENGIYVVTSGCVGNLPFVDNADIHYAQSAIYTPSDTFFARDGIAAQASSNDETVVVQDLDLQLLRRHRRMGAVQTLRDRRTDIYQVSWEDPGSKGKY